MNDINLFQVNLIFPVIFLCVVMFLIVLTARQNPVETGISALILMAGIPLYWVGFKWKKPIILLDLLGENKKDKLF